MLKKLLIVIGFLTVLGIVGLVFVGNKIDSELKEKEPEFRQYVTMTTEEQNAYVEKNFIALFSKLASINETDEKLQNSVAQLKADSEALQAGIAVGRSLIAGLILANEDILKDLSTEIHNKLKAEAEESDSRADKFKVYMDKYFPKEK